MNGSEKEWKKWLKFVLDLFSLLHHGVVLFVRFAIFSISDFQFFISLFSVSNWILTFPPPSPFLFLPHLLCSSSALGVTEEWKEERNTFLVLLFTLAADISLRLSLYSHSFLDLPLSASLICDNHDHHHQHYLGSITQECLCACERVRENPLEGRIQKRENTNERYKNTQPETKWDNVEEEIEMILIKVQTLDHFRLR